MDDKKKLLMYMHAGSKNHGCEAIVDSLCGILDGSADVTLLSYRKEEDLEYSLKDKCEVFEERSFDNHRVFHILYFIYRKLTKDAESFIRFRFKGFINKKEFPVAVSIGGDNYCYPSMLNDLHLSNSAFHKEGVKTILLGCSIEPELLKNQSILDDLALYDVILARESITYEALKSAGIANAKLVPDSAFSLKKKEVDLPKEFIKDNTVGINISPMIQDNETKDGITLENYRGLITYILESTRMNIALIPHVVWNQNDDRIPIKLLYEEFVQKGYKNRLCLIEDCSCEELKGYISKCRFFVGARTHSTIAAYSTGVPTLVVGYSVKALGIAKDLFPDYAVENLVLPVQNLKNSEELTNSFKWIMEHESSIRFKLEKKLPSYISSCYDAKKEIMKLL